MIGIRPKSNQAKTKRSSNAKHQTKISRESISAHHTAPTPIKIASKDLLDTYGETDLIKGLQKLMEQSVKDAPKRSTLQPIVMWSETHDYGTKEQPNLGRATLEKLIPRFKDLGITTLALEKPQGFNTIITDGHGFDCKRWQARVEDSREEAESEALLEDPTLFEAMNIQINEATLFNNMDGESLDQATIFPTKDSGGKANPIGKTPLNKAYTQAQLFDGVILIPNK